MGYAKRLQKQFKGLSELSGSTLQKRRDKLNRAGYAVDKQTAEFSTAVRGKEKRKGSSRPPRAYPTVSQFGK